MKSKKGGIGITLNTLIGIVLTIILFLSLVYIFWNKLIPLWTG